jgi:outer membrane biosynthesis protein TonB
MEPVAGRRDDMTGLRALLADAQRRDPLEIEIELRRLVLQRLSAATEDDATPASGRGWRTLSDWNPFIKPRPEVVTLTEPAPTPEPPLAPEPEPEPAPAPARAEIEVEAPAPQPAPIRRGISDEEFNDLLERILDAVKQISDIQSSLSP